MLGLVRLAMTLGAHWHQVRGSQSLSIATKLRLRVLGGVAPFASLQLCLLVDHPSMAALVWIMALAASAMLVAFTFTWRPQMFAPLVAWVQR